MEARESLSAQHCARGDSGSPSGAARAGTGSVLTALPAPEVSEEEEEEESARARPDNPTL